MGSCVPGHALFSENFKGVMSGVSLGTCLSNLNSITLTVLEQLTFNAQKYRGNVALGTRTLRRRHSFSGSDRPLLPWQRKFATFNTICYN